MRAALPKPHQGPAGSHLYLVKFQLPEPGQLAQLQGDGVSEPMSVRTKAVWTGQLFRFTGAPHRKGRCLPDTGLQ